ncbi:MAG TPA: DUF1287 domain-containing protein [Oscillospiraceae bacterium]|nr:DUF1287 domain-containing protein [Oscillospiraceae bacterium]
MLRRKSSSLIIITLVIVVIVVLQWIKVPGESLVEKKPSNQRITADNILLGARAEAKKRVRYNAAYAVIAYPGGDISQTQGACTDVVIRALRNADIDLQVLIHQDMQANFALYPQDYGLDAPDPNIDHRRVRNQMVFFSRFGQELPLTVADQLETWQWGDIVSWRCADGQLHTGIVSDRTNRQGIPLVIHNNSVTKEEDCLQRWDIIGHYRYPAVF